MAKWRAAAIERLPDLRELIASSDSITTLWIELGLRFSDAYRDPQDESRIAAIYSYADWCLNAPSGHDASTDPTTAVLVAFYEHLPQLPAARDDMPRWFRYSDVASNASVFSRHIGEKAFQDLLKYLQKHSDRYVKQR